MPKSDKIFNYQRFFSIYLKRDQSVGNEIIKVLKSLNDKKNVEAQLKLADRYVRARPAWRTNRVFLSSSIVIQKITSLE